MKVEFNNSFLKDVKRLKNERVSNCVIKIIEEIEKANSTQDIEGLVKLKGGVNNFRIRVGDYRIGLKIEANTVYFIRVLHRKDIYQYFP